MAWLSHFGGLCLVGWAVFLIGVHWVELGGIGWNWVELGGIGWNWVELGGIGIARGVSRTSVRVSRETYPPYCPPLLDNNRW